MKLFTYYSTLLFLFPVLSVLAQPGCTDYQATNFNPSATINDGSCLYPTTALPLTFKCYIDSTEIAETSGITKDNNKLWTHVDDTYPILYRIDSLTDSIFQRVTINNAGNIDWEDMTSDSSYLYIGDVGNNDGNRTNLRFYKVLKSDISDTSLSVNAGIINFSYSDQVNFNVNHNNNFYDCEAFFFMNDSIHLFTKGWVNKWTKHYVLTADTGTHIAQLVDSFNVTGLITSASIQGDSLVVLLGLNFSGGNNCFVWMLNDFTGSRFFSGNKRKFSIGSPFSTGQTEGICFADANKGYITNERISFGSITVSAKLREFNLYPFIAPSPPAPVISTSINSIFENLRACSDSGTSIFFIRNTSSSVGQDLIFTFSGLPSWLSASPVSDTLAPGDSMAITLQFTSGIMAGGNYPTTISIQSNDPFRPVKNISFTLSIDSNPCMSFTTSSDTCTGTIHFNSTSINTPITYYWNFGDGDTSSATNPVHSYGAAGNYLVTLVGCNAAGCDTVVQTVQPAITGPRPANCYPSTQSYCCGIGITHFRLTGSGGDVINKLSNDASAGFEDFTCLNPSILHTNYPYSLICTTALSYPEYLKVWLDMNNDGILDSVSEELYSDLDTIAPLHTGTLSIPSLPNNVYGIPIRMRVGSDFQQVPRPCLNPQNGQHEDYTVILNLSVGMNENNSDTRINVYPNPFNRSTTISFTLNQSSYVKLEVFNMLGERIAFPVDRLLLPGQYNNPLSVPVTGVYFVRFSADENVTIKRIVMTNQ